ncbi:MAG: DUF1800 domain-containing protein [Saprospiraceae bacterium]|nr:DUF1800 domain-containing protein [Saprospiraceae bacterium]
MKPTISSPFQPRPLPSGTLTPYTGPWTFSTAAHLLRRTTFGPSLKMINEAETQGLNSTLDELFTEGRFPTRPLNPYATNDPEVKVGETWINADQSPASGLNLYRIYSLTSWYIKKLQSEEFNILEKMVLFWHNHFVVSEIESPALFYNYFETLEKFALGNFREFTKEVTVNPGMLRYLNGNTNTKQALNENYARELLELFTIGKGPIAAPGDYTTFTEQDVRAISKALTGWNYTTPYKIVLAFDNSKHDTSVKTLSHRFGNQTIANLGDQEYKKVVDIIFEQDECSRFIARELYKWFVNHHLTQQIEVDIIEPMAKMIRDDNYVIKNAVRALLNSEHFFSDAVYGCMIKAPMDFIMSISNSLKFPVPNQLHDNYAYFNHLWTDTHLMGQTYSEIPEVAGWKAYYQEPLFYRHWINGVSLQDRKRWIDKFINKGISFNSIIGIKIPVLDVIKEFSDPGNITSLLTELGQLIFTHPLTNSQTAIAKDVILKGLPNYEWTVEYEDYVNDPNNKQKKDAIENKLRALFTHLMNLPEFQLQ